MVRSVDDGHSTCFAIVKPGLGKTATCVTGMHTAAKTLEDSRLTASSLPTSPGQKLEHKMRHMREGSHFYSWT